jgi:hypothetical protein
MVDYVEITFDRYPHSFEYSLDGTALMVELLWAFFGLMMFIATAFLSVILIVV